jgi:predicted ribosome quality control (RQC) complex YloA/Tae2 family protein
MVSAEFMKAEIARVEEFYQAKFKEMEKEAKAHAEESSKVIGRLQRQIEKLEAELKAVKKAAPAERTPLKELSMNLPALHKLASAHLQ